MIASVSFALLVLVSLAYVMAPIVLAGRRGAPSCARCGAAIGDGEKFCASCGMPAEKPPPAP